MFDISLSKELIETIKDNFVHTKDYTLKIHTLSNDFMLEQFAKDCGNAFNIKTEIIVEPKNRSIFNDFMFEFSNNIFIFEFSDNIFMLGQPDGYEFKLFYYIMELMLLTNGSGVSRFNMNKIKSVSDKKTLELYSKSSCSACYQLGKQMIQSSFFNPNITSFIKIVDESTDEFKNEKFPVLNIYSNGTIVSKNMGPVNLFSKL